MQGLRGKFSHQSLLSWVVMRKKFLLQPIQSFLGRFNMLKKLFLLFLALTLILSVAACGKTEDTEPEDEENGDEIIEEAWKIGIMTGTVTQNEEEFRMAEQMLEEFGSDRIVITTYPDKFMQEQETTISNMLELAQDPDMKAIIMVQAVPGAVAAVDKVREVRPDIDRKSTRL